MSLVGYGVDLAAVWRLVELVQSCDVQCRSSGLKAKFGTPGEGGPDRAQQSAVGIHNENGARERGVRIPRVLSYVDSSVGVGLPPSGSVTDVMSQLVQVQEDTADQTVSRRTDFEAQGSRMLLLGLDHIQRLAVEGGRPTR